MGCSICNSIFNIPYNKVKSLQGQKKIFFKLMLKVDIPHLPQNIVLGTTKSPTIKIFIKSKNINTYPKFTYKVNRWFN